MFTPIPTRPKGRARDVDIPSRILFAISIVFGSLAISACSDTDDFESIKMDDSIGISLRSGLDIQAIHDEYSEMIADSIVAWRTNNELDTGKFIVVWHLVNTNLATTFGVPVDTVVAMFSRMGITSSNYRNLYSLRYTHFSSTNAEYLDSLALKAMNGIDLSTEGLMDVLTDEIESWGGTIDTSGINSILAVSNSTFPFWRENFGAIDTLYNPLEYATIDPKRKRGAAHLALGDATGALWGFLIGGPAGALGGAVGSTLGAAIDMAVLGY